MASVRNRVVKKKKKGASSKARPGKVNAKLPGFALPRFSDDLLTHRNARGMTQREVGKAIGASNAAIVFIENGKSSPKAETFAKLCQFFKLDPTSYIPEVK